MEVFGGRGVRWGAYRYKDGNFTRFGRKAGIVDPAIRAFCEDHNGDLWIGTSRALYLMHNGGFQRFTTKEGLPNNVVRSIYEDRAGNLWVGTIKGLARRQDGHFTLYGVKDGLSDDCILCFYEDQEGSLWLGTGYGGLNRLRNGKFTSYSRPQACSRQYLDDSRRRPGQPMDELLLRGVPRQQEGIR